LIGHSHVPVDEFNTINYPHGNAFAYLQKRILFGSGHGHRKRGIPMIRRNWKRTQPTSLRNALELCKEFAREKHNLSVERIAERMGEADHWTLYKWMQTGRIPAVAIPAYEAACGIDFVTRWLAGTSGKLLINVPSGRKLKPNDVSALQESLHSTVSALMDFYNGKAEADATLATVTNALESLAWHKGNVEQHNQPQLDLGESND
jgi:hypothetical protein